MINAKTELAYKLIFYRKQNGMTQKDVADILKINRTTYTKYETGVTEPNVASLRKLSEIFGVDLNSLLSVEDPCDSDVSEDTGSDSEIDKEMMSLFKQLPVKDKEKLLSQLKKRLAKAENID